MAVNKTKPNIVAAFQRIGSSVGTQPPTQNNLTAILHEWYVSKVLYGLAETREEIAKGAMLKHAMEAGFKPLDVAPGDLVSVINDNKDYYVSLKVNQPAMKVNLTRLETELIKLGVKKSAIDTAMLLATEAGTPAKIYTITPRY